MTMTKLQAALALAALGAWSALAAANFPVGTHIIKGSVMGYNESGLNILLSSESGVRIQAVDANGNIIADTSVKDPAPDGVNFALEIPLSKTATDLTCAVGDKLNCVMVESSGILVSTEPVTVGGALESQTVNLKMVAARRYVSQDGAKTNSVIRRLRPAEGPGVHGRTRDGDHLLRIRGRARVRREDDGGPHSSGVDAPEGPRERVRRGVLADRACVRPRGGAGHHHDLHDARHRCAAGLLQVGGEVT